MITTLGKQKVIEVFAGQETSLATYMAFGIGSAAEALGNTALSYEVTRVQITSVSADTVNGRVVYKGVLPPGTISTLYEIGLYSGEAFDLAKVLSFTDPIIDWTNATIVTTNSRITGSTVKVDFVTSGTTNAELLGISEDLSTFVNTDSVYLAFHASTNLSSLRIRLGTDASNYFQFTVASPTVGYNTQKFNVADATVVGTPDWAAITYMAIRPSATAGGGGSVWFDGMRFEPPAGTLVARELLSSPTALDTSIESEIEYALEVDVP